jgi:hypothetical protein
MASIRSFVTHFSSGRNMQIGVHLTVNKLLSWALIIAIALGCATLTPIEVPSRPYWTPQNFPLHIDLDLRLGNCRASRMAQAAAYWNYELALAGAPKTAFKYSWDFSDSMMPGHIWVTSGPFPAFRGQPRVIASCRLGQYKKSPRIWGAVITMSNEHCLFRTSAHELGHALGLDHAPDECVGCIMNAQVPAHEGHLVDQGWLRPSEIEAVLRQMGRAKRRL